MSDRTVTNEEFNHMIKTIDCFSRMIKNTESFCRTNRDMKLAMKCAKEVETICDLFKSRRLHHLFIQHMCNAFQMEEDLYDFKALQYACDVILEAVLTHSDVPSASVLCGVSDYLELCGETRFSQLVSTIIVQSEVCRVLMDFIAITDTDPQNSIIFQANLLLRTLTVKGSEAVIKNSVYDWLNSEEQNRIQVTFQAISEAGVRHHVSEILIKGLVSVLDDRKETSILYWSTLISFPMCISVLRESNSLMYASLDFLTKSVEHFECTLELIWTSVENGPCQVISFDMIVQYVQYLRSADDNFKSIIENFIRERCTLPRCSFWEDVSLKLT